MAVAKVGRRVDTGGGAAPREPLGQGGSGEACCPLGMPPAFLEEVEGRQPIGAGVANAGRDADPEVRVLESGVLALGLCLAGSRGGVE